MEVAKELPRSRVLPGVKPLTWSWNNLVLGIILLGAGLLRIINLSQNGYGNSFYAAAVKSMLTSWHNFFFASFDSGGFVTVDKPPVALWIQAAFAKVFGFNGISLLLPQALAGILGVALLYFMVSRTFGKVAGLLAALVLAITPISVATDRDNNMDSILALFLLLGALGFLRAIETKRWRWLLIGAVMIGIAFNVKMLEGLVVVPAFYLAYMLATNFKEWPKQTLKLAAATVLLLAVAFSWALIVDAIPATQRPYIDNSTNNTVIDLIFGYNGIGREQGTGSGFGRASGFQPPAGVNIPSNFDRQFSGFFGSAQPGPWRLFDPTLASQIAWLFPLVLFGMLAIAWKGKWRLPLDNRKLALVLWGGWLLIFGAVLSFDKGIFHPYYTAALAAPIAALVGAGVSEMWNQYRSGGWRSFLMPVSLIASAAYEVYVLKDYSEQAKWLDPIIVAVTLVTVLILIIWQFRPNLNKNIWARGALIAGVFVLLFSPGFWAITPVLASDNGGQPSAGPALLNNRNTSFRSDQFQNGTNQANLIRYLEDNRNGSKFLVATLNSMSAEPIILESGQPVMSLGGFSGNDHILNTDQLTALVKNNTIHYFLLQGAGGRGGFGVSGFGSNSPSFDQNRSDRSQSSPVRGATGGFGGRSSANNQLVNWIQSTCKPVSVQQSQGSGSNSSTPNFISNSPLYYCS